MRYFLDAEFMEDGKTIDLISLGVVAEDGRTFYAESTDADLTKANEWVRANVIPHLGPLPSMVTGETTSFSALGATEVCGTRHTIAVLFKDFVDRGGPDPEFWGYYCDYDWVLVCQLFGTMMDLPEGWPKFCLDIKQLAAHLGNPTLPAQTGVEHHALADAQWNEEAWNYLQHRISGGWGTCDCGAPFSALWSTSLHDGPILLAVNCPACGRAPIHSLKEAPVGESATYCPACSGHGTDVHECAGLRSVVVRAADLKHLLEVYIDNGMVEAEDEEIVNRLGEALQKVEGSHELA